MVDVVTDRNYLLRVRDQLVSLHNSDVPSIPRILLVANIIQLSTYNSVSLTHKATSLWLTHAGR